MSPRRFLAALAAGALLLGACGDDDASDTADADTSTTEAATSEDDEYVEAMAASMQQDADLPFDDADVDCLAEEFVGALGGAERLESDGITPEDLRGEDGLAELGLELGQDEAEGIAASFASCDVSLAELVLAEAGGDVPPEMRSCVEENLDEDVLAEFFAAVLVDEQSSDEPPEELLAPLMACFGS